MQQPFSLGDSRGRRLRGLLILIGIAMLVTAALVTAFFLMRPGEEAPSKATPGSKKAAGPKSGYENRALWPAPPRPARNANAAMITGTVYDLQGRPVAGVQITATTFQIAGNQSTAAGTAESGEQGRFELRVAGGTYYLNGNKEGYSPTLAMAHSGDDIGLVLKESGVITGRVLDEQQRPVRQFSIDVMALTPDDMAAPAPSLSKRFDSPDGSFRIEQVPERGVILRATAEDFAPGFSPTLDAGKGSSQSVDITLSSGCVMTGIVEDESGVPVADVFLDAELRRNASMMGPTSFDASSEAQSDAEGRFRLEHVPLGDVLVRAYDGSHAVTTLATTVAACDKLAPVRLRMTAGGGLTGVVTGGDGKPVGGARLTLTHRSVGFVNTLSDDDGHYRFDKLPPGGMRIEAQRGTQRALAMVTITDGETAIRDLPFPAEGTGEVRGQVTAGGKPLSGMQLLLAANDGSGLMNMNYPVTGQDGTYRVAGLPEGKYVVIVSSTNQVLSAQVDKGAVQTVDIDVAVTPRPPTRPQPPADDDPPRDLDKDREAR